MDTVLKECINQLNAKGLTSFAYKERLMREYSVIKKLNFIDYMLIVQDVIRYAKREGILTGIARGSVAGSLVAFLMGITGVDPIKYNLLFERFLNPSRAFDPPDIDMDFQASRRAEVKQYLKNKYKNVCEIGSYSRLHASSALRDVARVLKVDDNLNDLISHKLTGSSLSEAQNILSSWICQSKDHQKAYEIAQKVEGLIRHQTIHASGVLILPYDIMDTIPISVVNGIMCSAWEDVYVAQLGYLKLDILGLVVLDIIKEVIQEVRVDLESIPLDDHKTLKNFAKGNTLGVFMFDTKHSRRITLSLNVSCFDDLVLATTIARPASWRNGVTDAIIQFRQKKRPFMCPKGVEELLKDTYGFPIFQEQIMKVMNALGNIPISDTEEVRSAIKKGKYETIQRYHEIFVEGAISNGLKKEEAEAVWGLLESANAYTFNKAHAVSYTIMSYWCMYLKTYYPLEFLTACLNNETDENKRSLFLQEISAKRYKVYPVDINLSSSKYKKEADGVRLGFCHIKGISEQISQEIVKGQPYKDLLDFCQRSDKRRCNKKIIELLQNYGVFSAEKDLLGETAVFVSEKQYNPEGFTYKMLDAWAKYLELDKWILLQFKDTESFCEELRKMPSQPKVILGLGDKIRQKLYLERATLNNNVLLGRFSCKGLSLDDPEYYSKNWTVQNKKKMKRMLDNAKTILEGFNQ